MGVVRIKLSSIDIDQLNSVIEMIKDLSNKSGINMRGPIPLPTRRMKVTTRKSSCGDGTATFDRFEMRVHKRIIDMPAQDRVLRPLMMLKIPRSVQIKIDIKE
ncbi:30S ribosomal protein S10 [Candidatus Pacearchaeota archaeon]|nr:30S ribosomal protein S10 [Candidatus Pacearchaeota archaeon]